MIVCIKCGAQNPPGSNYCSNCMTALPRMVSATTESQAPPQINERYLQLKDAGERVKAGEWTIEEYGDFLQNIRNVLAQREKEIRSIEIPEEAAADFARELEVGFSGIELYSDGIASMMLYLDDQNPEHIERGLELVSEGNEKINEAMKINRENRRKLEEMYSDSTTTA